MLCYEKKREVIIAFDRDEDQEKAERVEKFRDALAEQVLEDGMKAYLARWDAGNEIDDAKAAGAKVEILGWPNHRRQW